MARQNLNDGETGAGFRAKLNAMFLELFGFNQGILPLQDAASVLTDCGLGNSKFKVILGGNRVLVNPSNMQIGVEYTWYVVQDATGSRTLTYDTYFTWADGTIPVYSTAANAVDRIKGEWDGLKLRCTFQKGFA
jgi:hypothetical protein